MLERYFHSEKEFNKWLDATYNPEEFKRSFTKFLRKIYGGQMKTKDIYVVVHASGWYSDYAEYVVGVTDSYAQAIQFANREASYTNHNERWIFDHDSIVIRKYRLNEFKRNLSKAEAIIRTERDNETVIWKEAEHEDVLEMTDFYETEKGD